MSTATPSRGSASVRKAITEARREAGRRSFRAFSETYLPAYFRDAPSSMHLEVTSLLEEGTARRGARLAIAAPRGHAKTSIVSTAYALWCICYQLEPYIVLVSNTADQSKDLLSHLKRELESNSRILEDFPEVCEVGAKKGPPRWRKDEIITRSGTKVTAVGVGGSVRGRKHGEHRPSLVILDDIENEADVRNPEQRERLSEWFHKAIAKLGNGTTNIIVVGTILHYDALLARLVDPSKIPGWTGRVYRAVVKWSDRPDLWQTWEGVYSRLEEYEGTSGPEAADRYYLDHKDDLLSGAEVLWPAHEGYLELMKVRLREGRAAFDCEKQNEPTNPEDCLFRESDFRYWDDQYKTEEELILAIGASAVMYGAVDPSLGRHGKKYDDTALITLLKDTSTGIHYVLDADIRKRKPDEILEAAISYHRRRRYQRFGVESNQFQEVLADQLVERSRQRGEQVPVHKITHTTDKKLRIETLQPLVSAGTIRFSRRHTVLLDQLRQYPHAAHDDGPDALEMAVEVARGTEYGVYVSYGDDAGPDDGMDGNWTPLRWSHPGGAMGW